MARKRQLRSYDHRGGTIQPQKKNRFLVRDANIGTFLRNWMTDLRAAITITEKQSVR